MAGARQSVAVGAENLLELLRNPESLEAYAAAFFIQNCMQVFLDIHTKKKGRR